MCMCALCLCVSTRALGGVVQKWYTSLYLIRELSQSDSSDRSTCISMFICRNYYLHDPDWAEKLKRSEIFVRNCSDEQALHIYNEHRVLLRTIASILLIRTEIYINFVCILTKPRPTPTDKLKRSVNSRQVREIFFFLCLLRLRVDILLLLFCLFEYIGESAKNIFSPNIYIIIDMCV